MFDSVAELTNKIRLGEDSTIEFKSVRCKGDKIVGPKRDDLVDELAAMANTADAVCVLGIDSLSLRQATRNELITSLLARCPVKMGERVERGYYMEKRGDGVPIILKESMNHSGKAPTYRLIDEAELLLTIYSAPLPNQN